MNTKNQKPGTCDERTGTHVVGAFFAGDNGSEGLRLQLVLSDPSVIPEQLWLTQEQHVQVQTHTHTRADETQEASPGCTQYSKL